MVQSMVAAIGRILEALAAAGRAHDTLVFNSDNGGER